MKLFGLVLLSAATACAQAISVGAIGGVPFTDAVNTVQTGTYSTVYKSTNFVAGPSLRINLPASLRIEVDALYRPISFQQNAPGFVSSVSASQWRFPLLLQYSFKTPVVKPFVEAGLSFEHLSGLSAQAAIAALTNPLDGTSVPLPGAVLHTSNASVVLGGGVDVKIPFVRLSGELRFSRASVAEFQSISNLNTAEVLLGVHF